MSGPTSTSFPALGTTAVVVADPDDLDAAVLAVGSELDDIDRTCSRFRADSDVSRVNDAGGAWTTVDRLLVEAVEVALRAASITGGLVDPTIGEAMLRIGYDRDFAEIPTDGPALPTEASWLVAPAWRLVEINHERSQVRAPRGVRLDLGSTAKALAADRAASRAADVGRRRGAREPGRGYRGGGRRAGRWMAGRDRRRPSRRSGAGRNRRHRLRRPGDVEHDRAAMGTWRPARASHRRPAHRPSRSRGVADGLRDRGFLRRCEYGVDRLDRAR